MGDLRLLASNLIEIANAQKPKDELVTLHRHFLKGSCWLGRLIKWLTAIFSTPVKTEAELSGTIDKIRVLFFEEIELLKKVETDLRRGIKSSFKGQSLEGNLNFSTAKNKLLNFSRFFYPLMKEIRKGREVKVLVELLANLAGDPKKIREKAAFLKDLFYDLHFFQKVFHCEQVAKTPLPLSTLYKMSLDIALKVREEKEVKKWLDAMQASAKEKIPSFKGPVENTLVKARYLHRLLYAIVEYVNTHLPNNGKRAELEVLETRIASLGYKIFDEEDPKHIIWRNNLKEGLKMPWAGREVVLSKIIQNPEKDPTKPIVFAVKDDPSIELVSFPNETMSYGEGFKESILSCGVPAAEVIGISQYGRILVRKRLHHFLHEIRWTSLKTKIGQDDTVNAAPIVSLMSQLKDRPFTPYPLLPERLGFTTSNEMRATDYFVPGMKSFEALEAFAYECAFGKKREFNPAVFSHLMVESGLGETEWSKRYQKLFNAALNDADKEKSVYFVGATPAELERREVFYDWVKELYVNGIDEILTEYEIDETKELTKEFKKQLFCYYKNHCPGSYLVESLVSRAKIYTLMSKKFRPYLKPSVYEMKRAGALDEMMAQKRVWQRDGNYYKRGIFEELEIKAVRSDANKMMASSSLI